METPSGITPTCGVNPTACARQSPRWTRSRSPVAAKMRRDALMSASWIGSGVDFPQPRLWDQARRLGRGEAPRRLVDWLADREDLPGVARRMIELTGVSKRYGGVTVL